MVFFPFIYKVLKDEVIDGCKKKSFELYGWSGSISVITAYGLTTFGSDKHLLIDILNLYGSLSIGIMCYKAKVWQATLLEVAWFGVGTYSIIKNIVSDESELGCH
jgi:hypothetical protein